MRSIILVIVVLFVSGNLLAQKKGFVKGKIVFTDGTTKEGHIKPMKTSVDKTLIFMADENSEKEKIATESLKEFYIIEEGVPFRYAQMKSFNAKKTKVNPRSFWVQEVVSGKASLYASYTPDSRIRSSGGTLSGMPGDITFYGIKKGEEAMSMIGIHFIGAFNVNTENTFRNLASEFFKEDAKLVERINNKEWKLLEAPELFAVYNKAFSSK